MKELGKARRRILVL